MPEEIEQKIRQSVEEAHPDYDKERVDKEVFSTMNKHGLLHRGKRHRKKRKDHWIG